MRTKTLVVISYYDRRPSNNLFDLIESLYRYSAGDEFDTCVVVNRTKRDSLTLPDKYSYISVEYRQNLGMNIGAWDYGWRSHEGYRDYLFLQDECYVIRDQWLAGYRSCLSDPQVGMVGESIPRLWYKDWPSLRQFFAGVALPEHSFDGEPVNRIDFYLKFFKEHDVEPGETGRHLRSVIWCLPAPVLEKIGGFLIGRNYGECIAAEIAASKQVEALGLRVVQAKDEEFFYIRHLEYNQDFPGSPYAHDVKYVDYASVKRRLQSKENELWQLLKLKFYKFALNRLKRV